MGSKRHPLFLALVLSAYSFAANTHKSHASTGRSGVVFLPTSICEALASPVRFDRKKVKFKAKYSGTFEGSWLSDDQCKGVGTLMFPGYSELAQRYGIETRQHHSIFIAIV